MQSIKNFFFPEQSRQPQLHTINGKQIQQLTLIAEGGYGYIWRALDIQNKKILILKEILCQSDQAIQQAKTEIKLHKTLGIHPNIVQFYDGTIVSDRNQTIALVAMEMCEGGTLFDLLHRHKETRLNEEQILHVLRDLIDAIKHLHSQNPPIIHRDIKVENVLIHRKIFKLCDFGSASCERIDLAKVSKQEMSRYEEIFEKNTTLMYRPPEMSDIYQRYIVDERVDIWMLGCVLYTMCYYIHPFQDASKLAIVQASYRIPNPKIYSEKMIDLIRILLTPNPEERPSIFEVDQLVKQYHGCKKLEFKREIPKQEEHDEFTEFQSQDLI